MAQHANLFDRDHSVSVQALTSPGHEKQLRILGLGYRIPLYALGDSLEFAYGNSNVDSGSVSTAAGAYDISGRGEFFSARYHLGLPRWQGNEQKLSAGIDWRLYDSKVVPLGGTTSVVPTLTAAPLSLGYTLASPEGSTTWKANVTGIHNLPSGGNGSTAAYNQAGARTGARGNYALWRWSAGISTTLPQEWRLRLDANGQETRDALISGEQFGIGGMDSVRGYSEREVLNDRGWKTTLELATPQTTLPVGNDWRAHLVGFADAGGVVRNQAAANEQLSARIAAIGIGARVQLGATATLRLDVAQALKEATTTRKGDVTAHVQMMMVF
jgi:hemolysin activation/secretion protein